MAAIRPIPVHHVHIMYTLIPGTWSLHVSIRSTSAWAMYTSRNELSVLFINQAQMSVMHVWRGVQRLQQHVPGKKNQKTKNKKNPQKKQKKGKRKKGFRQSSPISFFRCLTQTSLVLSWRSLCGMLYGSVPDQILNESEAITSISSTQWPLDL